MVEKVEILQHCESRHFGSHSRKESIWLLCIVAYHHELIVQLGEHRLYPLPEPLVSPCGWLPVLLIEPVGHIQCDVGGLEEVKLYRCTQIPLVPHDHAIVVFPLDVLKIMQVMHVCGSHVIGVYDTADAAQGMEFVAVITHVLRGAVAPGGRAVNVRLSHGTPLGSCILAHFDGFGVNAEDRLSAIDGLGYPLTDFLPKGAGELSASIELPAADEIGDGIGAFLHQPVEEINLAVDAERFSCEGKGDHFNIGEGGNNTTARYISSFIYTIFCKTLADVKNFSELCNEVVHNNDNWT